MEMKGRAGYLQEPATGCGLRCHDLCRCGRGGARKKPEEGSSGKEGDDGRPPGRRRHPSKGCRPALISASAAGVPLQAGLHLHACCIGFVPSCAPAPGAHSETRGRSSKA